MSNLSTKQKIIAAVIALGAILIVIFNRGFSMISSDPERQEPGVNQVQSQNVEVVATSPNPLEGATILPSQEVEIFFSEPMVNDPARITIEPSVKYNAQLSADHKTLKIQPLEPYKLGQGYTLTIKSGYASDNGKKLDSDKTFHFQTISYNGV